jgi:nicotinamide-nucleotide amidase
MRQAWLPEGTELVVNDYGTAPSFAIERAGTLALMLPGVPDEMRSIVSDFLAPRLREMFPGRLGVVRTTILLAAGLGEGLVDHRLADLLSSSVNPKLGLLAGIYETRILVTTKGRDERECSRLEAPILEEIHRRLGESLVGRGQDGLSSSIGRLLSERRSRLAVVDAATGGRLAERLRPSLRPGTLAGALTVSPENLEAALTLARGPLGADIVALVTAEPTGPPAADGQLDLIGRFRITAPGPDGSILATGGEAKVAGPPDLALDRLASLAAWRLWRRLTGRDDPASPEDSSDQPKPPAPGRSLERAEPRPPAPARPGRQRGGARQR